MVSQRNDFSRHKARYSYLRPSTNLQLNGIILMQTKLLDEKRKVYSIEGRKLLNYEITKLPN